MWCVRAQSPTAVVFHPVTRFRGPASMIRPPGGGKSSVELEGRCRPRPGRFPAAPGVHPSQGSSAWGHTQPTARSTNTARASHCRGLPLPRPCRLHPVRWRRRAVGLYQVRQRRRPRRRQLLSRRAFPRASLAGQPRKRHKAGGRRRSARALRRMKPPRRARRLPPFCSALFEPLHTRQQPWVRPAARLPAASAASRCPGSAAPSRLLAQRSRSRVRPGARRKGPRLSRPCR